MDFTDTPEEAAYRSKAKTWLETNAPKFARKTSAADEMDAGEVDWDDMKRAKAWQARKAEGGYAQITWPKEWGGGGGTPIQSVIFGQEEAKFDVGGGYFAIGLGMCVPTVMAFADDATKARFVGPALRGEEIWCQLFSEPAGGSDVAAARTRAVRDGDDWVINGQKVWTSGAHYSDFGIIICRTNPDVPKHKGMTMFWVDMKSPGIEVRPIHQMSGGSNFNEVYFTDVRVKDSQRLGAVDEGWGVSLVTLMNERLAVGGGGGLDYSVIMSLARELVTDKGSALSDQAFREKLADWYVQSEGLKYTRFRHHHGAFPGRDARSGKLDRQDHRGWPAAGPGELRCRDGGPVRHHRRCGGRAPARGVPGRAALLAGHAHRRRHRRDPEEHHRRTRPGPARRDPRRQGRAVQGHAPRTVVDEREGNHGKHGKHGRPACVAR